MEEEDGEGEYGYEVYEVEEGQDGGEGDELIDNGEDLVEEEMAQMN
jgi:hypothetical protein